MSVDKLVAWAEDEANSPYLRSYPLKSRPFRKDFKGKVLFTKRYNHEDKGFDYYPPLNGDEGIIQYVEGMHDGVDGLNDVARVGHNMEVDNVKDMNDVGNGVNIDEEVLARQKKIDKGKHTMTEDDIVTIKKIMNVCRGNGISMRENDNHISLNNESDSEDNVDEYADMYSESDSDESDKSFDYLSNGEDKVTELRKRKFEFKNTTDEADGQEGPTEAEQDTPNGVDKYTDVDDNGTGLSPLVRQYEKYMEALLKKLKGNRIGITYPFAIVEKSKERNAKTFALNEGDAAIQDHYGLPRGLFWAASKASYAQLFNKMMEKIRRANPKAHENLVKKEPKTWSRAFSNEGICCEAMKNGLSKCFNYVLDSVTKRFKEE
ncbi:hypothetical protein Tco_1140942 [Tanacetum coccineum]